MADKPTFEELHKHPNLKKSNKFQALLDCAGVLFVEIDTKGIVTLVNKKTCEVFGYTEAEMLGKNWFENFLPERIKNEILPISKKLLSGEVETAEYYENHERKKHAWMIAFAPFDTPRYAIAVVCEDADSGGLTAAAVLRELFVYLFPDPVSDVLKAPELI